MTQLILLLFRRQNTVITEKKEKKNVPWNSVPKYDTDNVFGLNQNLNYQTWITL